MRKKIFSIIIFIIMILPFYVNADTGNITISCNPSAIKAGNTTECTINGKTDNEITSIDTTINLSDNLEIVSFTPQSSWQGNDLSDKKISVYREETVKSDFTIGLLTLKAKDNVTNKDEKITLSNTTFSHDKEEYEIVDASANIRIPSSNNNLSSIKVNGDGAFFSKNKTSFDIELKDSTANIVVTKEDSKAKVTGDGTKNLNYGKNTYNIVVTAEDGTKKTYTLNITRPDSRSKENYLLDFNFVNYDIGFDKNKTSYELTIDNKESNLCFMILDGKNRIGNKLSECLLFVEGDISDKAQGGDFIFNGDSIYEVFEILEEYLSSIESAEEKCNDHETECSYYLNNELVRVVKDNDEYYEDIVYKNNKMFYMEYRVYPEDDYMYIINLADIKVGSNILEYKVIAENGDERVYTFKINRKDKDGKVVENDVMPPPTGNIIYIIIAVLLVLSLCSGIYFYRKKNKS